MKSLRDSAAFPCSSDCWHVVIFQGPYFKEALSGLLFVNLTFNGFVGPVPHQSYLGTFRIEAIPFFGGQARCFRTDQFV